MLAGLTPSLGNTAARGARVRPRRDARRRRRGAASRALRRRRGGPRPGGGGVGVMRHPTYKHLEAKLRLGLVLARPVGADHRGRRRRGGVRRLRVAVSGERDDLRVDRRRRAAGRRCPTARWGSSSRSREFAAAGVALLARAAALPRRRRRARRAATSFVAEPPTVTLGPSPGRRWTSGSRCGTSEAPAARGGAAGGGRAVRGRGARPRGPAGHAARARSCATCA